MLIYILLALVMALFSLFQNERNKNVLLTIGVGLLFVVSGLRGFTVGTDTLNYKMWFDYRIDSEIGFLSIRSGEFFFPLMMFFVQKLGGSYRLFVILIAAIYSIFIWVICRKSNRPVTVLMFFWLLGYYFMFYNLSRQLLAVILVGCSIFLLQKQRYIWWALLIMLASLIHSSALIAFLLFPLSKLRFTNNSSIMIVAILFISFILPFLINTRALAQWIDNLGIWGDTYSGYINNRFEQTKSLFSWNRLFMNVFYCVVLCLYKCKEKSYYITFVVVYIVVLNLFPFSGVIGRISIYWGCFQVLLLTEYGEQRTINRIFTMIYPLAVFSMYLISNNCNILPYVFGGK